MIQPNKFVVYLRVSTSRQGQSGLGIEAQRSAVREYLRDDKGKIVDEFVEIESGLKASRPQLEAALAAARTRRAALIVAKVDRLTRSVAFLSRLLEAGVDVRFCDLPQIEGATGRFMLTQLVAVAELEAGLISARTKAALAAAKKRGVRLGGDRGGRLTEAARKQGTEIRVRNARTKAIDLFMMIESAKAHGHDTLSGVARYLNEREVPTVRGHGRWHPVQVSRVAVHMRKAERSRSNMRFGEGSI
ncbi:DNA-invertase hin [Variibacter gotjawalensis]|uniref:DNA-invertase hin n=1 Tax=Variibacter gotjawalensis TaxID=1333996 RepID=A0A0S3PXG4_9BRAD|nr:recombinase family protein [Variibacter gotjawalensis]NIK46446.1 DNA invertase Pin-like site-specific DNA recombinase [Variibacter gotjawalensis]RZS48356.1 DNA invertase Pin-like site-specific DNA recombinase [Variibacter gotjawalensis]BAT60614.1 DNA-invertase hin [Variibacter gotjawalensis]